MILKSYSLIHNKNDNIIVKCFYISSTNTLTYSHSCLSVCLLLANCNYTLSAYL